MAEKTLRIKVVEIGKPRGGYLVQVLNDDRYKNPHMAINHSEADPRIKRLKVDDEFECNHPEEDGIIRFKSK